MVEMEKALSQERDRAADMAIKLGHNEVHHQLTENEAQAIEDWVRATEEQAKVVDDQAKAAKEKAISTITWVVEEYKNFDTFKADTTMAVASMYINEFDDYKAKVVVANPGLDLHRITVSNVVEEEKEEEEEGEIARE